MKKNFLKTYVIFFLGLCFSILLLVLDLKQQNLIWEQEFAKKVDKETTYFKSRLEINERLLLGIVSFYDASKYVDHQEFQTYVTPILKNYPFIQALEWIPRIRDKDKILFENRIKKVNPSFKITEREKQGRMIPAKKRSEYFPVYYVEPLKGNLAAHGFDLASNETRLKSLEEARDSGKTIATSKITLVQEKKSQSGFLIFAPIYDQNKEIVDIHSRRDALKGFGLAVFRVGDMVKDIFKDSKIENVNISIFEGDKINLKKSIYGEVKESFPLMRKTMLNVSGKDWLLVWQANDKFKGGVTIWRSWLLFIAVLLITSSLTFITFNLSSRAEKIEVLVKEKTNELLSKSLALEQEVIERTRAEEAAENASKVKSHFLATMSHEIRTPMNGVISCAHLLLDSNKDPDGLKLIKTILSCGDSLLTIIDDILAFSKLESEKIQIENAPFNLRENILDIQNLFSSKASEKGITLNTHIKEEVPYAILGDVTRFKQVLSNLVSNAIKFSKNKVEIHCMANKLSEDKYSLNLVVIDDGVGISLENQEKLFKSFSQVDNSNTRQFGGTGLGLAISKGLVELMGGSIWVSSKLGVGSEFHVSIEVISSVNKIEIKKSEYDITSVDPDMAFKHPLTILVAEDNSINQMITKRYLKKLGYDADFVVNGLEAIEKLKVKQFDLILMDQHMPVMDGVEATLEIVKTYGVSRPYIYAVTASVMEKERVRCMDAGMDGFLNKPLNIKQLVDCLSSVKNKRCA